MFYQAALRRFSKTLIIKYCMEKYASFLKFETSFIFPTNKNVVLGKDAKGERCWEITIRGLLEVIQLERCRIFLVSDFKL